MASTSDSLSGIQLPLSVRTYLDAVVQACPQAGYSPVSVIVFGSVARGGFSSVSDVDLILVLPDAATREDQQRLQEAIARLEIVHGFRPATVHAPGGLRARIERAEGHLFPCCVCTRSDLMSGNVARVLGLRDWEAPFLDRITFASIISSAVTVWGEDLLPDVPVPSVRRLDVFKACFALSCQVVLSIVTFPALSDATKYAMGALKHSLHSCFFCYHQRTGPLEEEVAFFNSRLGPSRSFAELLSLRRQYRRSFGFVIRCLPTIVRLHLRTARDSRFRRAG
jgi:predicted nucleotidyltransferase